MNRLIILFIALVMLAATQVACDGSAVPTATRDELGVLVDTQTQATVAAAKLNGALAEATTRAEATLQYLAIIGQQTRIAQQAVEMQTTQAQNARETQTIFAQRVTATQVAYIGQATATRVAQDATATAYSGQVTATRQSQDATATAYSAQATATRQAVEATQTQYAVVAKQTQVSASATATADAANALATSASARQTVNAAHAAETVTMNGVLVAQEKADWEKRTEAVRSIAVFAGIAIGLVALCVTVGFITLKLIAALDVRMRTQYDANGVPYIVLPPDKHGRQHLLAPSRAPGAVVEITPPQLAASNIQAGAVDADTTKRAQAVELMLAATSGQGVSARAAQDLIDDEGDAEMKMEDKQKIALGAGIAYKIAPLDVASRPSQLHLPIGITSSHREMWVPLRDISHALIGGPSGMGKSNFLHGWIQSLVAGESCDLALYDGKGGMEFGRYATAPRTDIVPDDLAPYLGDVLVEIQRRYEVLRAAGVNNLADYNRGRDTDDRLDHWVIVIDELYGALQVDGVQAAMETIAMKGRAEGIHLVMATQLPDARSVPRHLRINALARIAFAVPTAQNSLAILGYVGAEKIEKTPGRLLMFWQGQMIQAQSFRARLPMPSALPRREELASGETPLGLPASAFDDDTRRAIEYAVRTGQGWFVVTAIAEALEMRDSRVTRIARQLEAEGLLSEVQKDEQGRNLGRRVSEKLLGAMGA